VQIIMANRAQGDQVFFDVIPAFVMELHVVQFEVPWIGRIIIRM